MTMLRSIANWAPSKYKRNETKKSIRVPIEISQGRPSVNWTPKSKR